MKLSIVIPAYNESRTIQEVLTRVRAVASSQEIIVVDDGSTDGTEAILEQLHAEQPFILLRHPRRRGKGAALRTGLAAATGDVVIIQDADGEYHPQEYPALLAPIERGWADAVYGNRFFGAHRVFLLSHRLGNWLVNLVANLLYNTTLTDMETGFKAFRRDVLTRFTLRSDDFRIEVELTAKLFRHGFRVYEVPVSYSGRSYAEGKKLTWRDGVLALWALLVFRVRS